MKKSKKNRYDAKKSEPKWQKFWEKNRIFRFDKNSKKPVYVIDTPPPYASAEHLHMGHALNYTQFDIVAYFKRASGYNVYFPPCFDNNGLPTEKYVEEKLNISKKDVTKAEFRKICLKEARKVEKNYSERFFKALGHSYDWSLLYTTIDPESQKVAQTSFLDLIKKRHAYRAEEPTLWCPCHQTALAQAEVDDVQRTTKLIFVRFKLENGKDIEIATTRPELLAACVGIFVNPDDKRYKKLVGKKAIVPLFNHKVTIMADKKVDMEFGSGIVMVCTFGDNTDVEWWKEHNLELRIALTKDGKLNDLSGKYKGLTIKEAKKKITEDLDKKGHLIRQENLEQTVGVCWRCSTPIEFIVTPQWFIHTLKFKKEIIKYARKVRWHPGFYLKRLEDWTNNLGWNWCISRQRFFGVPIPVWYCKKCENAMFPEEKQLPIDPEKDKPSNNCKCGSSDFIPEEDVFDTWMTSSMSPEIATRWLEKPEQFRKLFPTSLRPQSHDIIRTWAFYTILKSYLHFKDIPWKDIMISNYVLDPKGRGMSKSKGNVVWLQDILEKYSADVVRYWTGTAILGQDFPFKEQDMVHGQKILIKLWNISRFASMNSDKIPKKRPDLTTIDKWILSRLNGTLKEYQEHFEKYNISKARRGLELFFLHDFCDFYIEMIKWRIYNDNKADAARWTLYHCLLSITKMFGPFIPHMTEEIYQQLFRKGEKTKSIHISQCPLFDKKMINKEAEECGEIAKNIIAAIRQYKNSNNLPLNTPLNEVVMDSSLKNKIRKVEEDIKGTMKINEIKYSHIKKADISLEINKSKIRMNIQRK